MASKYKGSGHVLAAVTNGRVVGLVYIHDVLPDYDDSSSMHDLKIAANDPKMSPVVSELNALGHVYVGICSAWELMVL